MQKNDYPSQLITFEGIDGSGKSHQLIRAKNYLASLQIPFVYTKEPTDQPSGKLIYDLLNGRTNTDFPDLRLEEMHRFHFQSFYFTDRVWNYKSRIVPSLRSGFHVLADRGIVSVVYGAQSVEDFKPLIGIQEQFFLTAGVPFIWPDLNIIYDVPVEIAMVRLKEQGKVLDQFETRKMLYRVRENYLAFAKTYSNCVIIDNTGDEHSVFTETKKLLAEILELGKDER